MVLWLKNKMNCKNAFSYGLTKIWFNLVSLLNSCDLKVSQLSIASNYRIEWFKPQILGYSIFFLLCGNIPLNFTTF